ncbi:hypothetical protein [Carnobacterium maltaromaticum]|uniref:hypothetical protein n=1 Tax=Carnobacterium maltaromaticum TaxID=2751 RepID=UPI0039B015EF
MEMNINAPVKEMPVTTILEQRADFIKSRAEYSNGVIFIMEQTATNTNISSNYNFKKEADGSLSADLTSKNLNFKDV